MPALSDDDAVSTELRGPQVSPRPERVAVAIELVACAVLAVMPYLWRLAAGTRDLANDDTWAYERMFATFLDHGTVELIDWNDINLVGVFPVARVWVALVGHGTLQLALLGSVMALIGLLALRSVLRELAPRCTLVGLVAYGLYGGFVFTAGTFMADQFAVAGALVALAAVVRLAHREASPSLTVALITIAVLASFFAFSVRQQTVVATGISCGILLLSPRAPRLAWLVTGVAFAVLAAPFYLWRWSLENPGSTELSFAVDELAGGWVLMVVGLSLALTPVVVHVSGAAVLRRAPLVRLVGSVVAAGVLVATEPSLALYDFMRRGTDGHLVVKVLVGVVCWNMVVTVALGIVERRPRSDDPLAWIMALAAGVSLAADVTVGALSSFYLPRYSLVTLALSIAAFALTEDRRAPQVNRAQAGAAVWALLALVGAWSYWALDEEQVHLRIVQDIADVTACAGIPDAELDAGIVWVGMHTDEPVTAKFWEVERVDDGLPPTQQQLLFAGQVRRAVVTLDEPEALEGTTVVGPFHGGGLLPGSEKDRWLVVRDEDAPAVLACAAEAGVTGVEDAA